MVKYNDVYLLKILPVLKDEKRRKIPADLFGAELKTLKRDRYCEKDH